MAEWVRLRRGELCQALQLKRGWLPHAATFRRVLGKAVDIEDLEDVVGTFLGRCQGTDAQVSIDGKSLWGTIPTGETRGIYLLAVYAPQAGVVLKQVEIGCKENELSA